MLPVRSRTIILNLKTNLLILFSLMLLVETHFAKHQIHSEYSAVSSISSSSFLRTGRSASDVYTVNFMLPDELPQDHFIGNIPKQIPNFPFLNILDSSVSSTLVDSSGFLLRLFRVTDNGEFYTQTLIDRDNADQLCGPLNCCHLIVCNLTVDVLFFHPGSTSITVHINLQIHDANDNPPYFPQQTFSLWIPEDNRLKYTDLDIQNLHRPLYGLPLAVDIDSAPNGVVQYRIHGSIPVTSTFQIYSNLSTEKLSLSIKPGIFLDYDKVDQRIYKLTIEAIDGGHPSRTGRMLVLVHITDVNDNIPVFKKSKDSIKIPENTMFQEPIYKVQATDADSDDNGLIKYTFAPANPTIPTSVIEKFNFHSNTGELYFRDVLDYETFQERQIELLFVAYDTGDPPLSATAQLTIYLQDINDNPPQLVVQLNNTIKENSEPGQLALRVMIRDKDEVSRDMVECRADADQNVPLKMTVSPEKTMLTIITTDSVDYEATPRLHYAITCLDEASPKQMRQFNLTISVGDVNDNAPKFKSSTFAPKIGHYKILLSEAEPLNKLVLIVTAEDADSGDNGRVSYSLMENDHSSELSFVNAARHFKIDSQTGSIFLIKRLDYERNDLLRFRVLAQDNPKPSDGTRMSAFATVIVQVLDVNDNGPKLKGSDTLSVVEHAPIGTDLGLIKFSDPDTGPGGQIAHVSLLNGLQITNKNGKHILQNKCNRNNDGDVYFTLSDSGHLLTMLPIDREECSIVFLHILAIDRGLPNPMTSTTTLTIQIVDINDNSPIIEKPNLGQTLIYQPIKLQNWDTITFYQLTSKYDKILNRKMLNSTYLKQNMNNKMIRKYIYTRMAFQIQAKDLDSGENGRITYMQNSSCNGSKYFHLDEDTGEFRARFIDYQKLSEPELIESDSRRGIYLFCVQLTDNGKPPLQTTSWFYVKVTDPVIPPTVHNIWPADSANDMEITQKLMFSNMHNSTHTLWSSHILDTLKSDSIRLATDMNISNIVISLLLAIFAITIVCTLTASILWARSKRRSKRLNEKNDKTDCRDKNRIISYNATSKTTHKCRLLKKSLKITSSSNSKCSKDISTTQELIKLENRGPHFCISNAGIGGQIKDKNRYFGSCSSLYSNKSSNDVNCNTELGSPSKKLTANIHVVNNPNTEDVNNNSNILTHVNSTQSPRYHKSKKQKCLHEKSVPVKHHSKTLFQRNKPLRISIDNNYVALNKLSHSSVHCEQQLKHSSQEHTPLTENKMHAASESSYLLPCDLISVCTKHGQTGDNGRLHNCDNTVTLTNSSLVNTQPTTSQIKYLEPYLHNHPNYPQITQSKTHVTPSCQQQEQQYPLQCAAHYVPIDINNSAYSPTQKKVDCSTNIFSEGMITCCQTIPIVSTLSRGCPTHGPHLILHHDEHNNFSNSTRIYAVSSVLDSFGDLTTTITTAPTSTGATSTTKILTDQIQTTYELRLEPVSSDITLTATTSTTDHEGEDGDDEQLRGAKTISWIPVSILTDNISSSIHQPDFMCHENN